jgi:mannosyltransferase
MDAMTSRVLGDSPSARMPAARERAGVAVVWAIAGLAFALRLYRLGHQSLWMDEVLTANSAGHSLATLLTDPRVDANFPPLHNVVLHLVQGLLGDSDLVLRLPSVIAGALSIPALYGAARHWVADRASVLAALLMAISPFHLWYSQEARPYAFLVLFGLLAIWCAGRLLEDPSSTGWLIGYVAAAAATFYCHIIAGPVLLALTLYLFLAVGPAGRRRVFVGALALGLILLPQVLRFLSAPPSVSGNTEYRAALSHVVYTFWAFVAGYSLGPSLLELRGGMQGVKPYLPLVLSVLALVAVSSGLGAWQLWRDNRRAFWFLITWVVLPIATAMAGAMVTVHPYNVRYAILAAPGFLVLCAVGIVALRSRAARIVAVVTLVLVQVAGLINYYAVPKYFREDNRAAARFLNANAGAHDLVVASAGYTLLPLRYYGLRPDLEVVPYPRTGIASAGQVSRDLSELLGSRQRVWVFLSRTFHSDPDGEIVRYLDSALSLRREFRAPGVRVLLYSRQGRTNRGGSGSEPPPR